MKEQLQRVYDVTLTTENWDEAKRRTRTPGFPYLCNCLIAVAMEPILAPIGLVAEVRQGVQIFPAWKDNGVCAYYDLDENGKQWRELFDDLLPNTRDTYKLVLPATIRLTRTV